jgi:hypothetical protein
MFIDVDEEGALRRIFSAATAPSADDLEVLTGFTKRLWERDRVRTRFNEQSRTARERPFRPSS